MSAAIAYRPIPPGELDAPPARWRERRMARALAALVARDLGLGAVEVRWFRAIVGEAGGRVSCGYVRGADPGVISLRAGQGPRRLLLTVAHECRHLWQAEQHGDWLAWWRECRGAEDRAAQEADADDYAEAVARAMEW